MPNGIEEIITFLDKYKDKSEGVNKSIDKILKTVEDRRYITDYDFIEELVKKYETIDVDNILYDIMLNVNRYNVYLMNKKIKFVEPNIEKDIEFDEIDINIDDILEYLEVKEPLDKNLEKDLKKYVKNEKNKEKLMDFVKTLKTSDNKLRTIFDKIQDKNVLVSILIHSDINLVNGVINKFSEKNININKVVENIPSIFIATKFDNKCKYEISADYSNFMGNIAYLDKLSIDYSNILKYPIFFVNNCNKNQSNIELLMSLGVNVKNILENCGNVFAINPEIIYRNIRLLKYHNIELTDDDNNNGYTILGMKDLENKIDYLIESNAWKHTDEHDNIDLIRALIIKDDYLKWKNGIKYDIIDNTSFKKDELDEEKVLNVYTKYPILNELDNKYLVNGNYVIGSNILSKHRLLSNLNNYTGKEDAMIESIKYNNNVSNIDELVDFFSSVKEMGEEVVKLSKGI